MSGCSVNSGATPSGVWPVKIVGTASVVKPAIVVWFRYQVAWPASRARFGNRTASIAPDASMIDAVGSSSSTISTTGAALALRGDRLEVVGSSTQVAGR